jgi:hypothetical protein
LIVGSVPLNGLVAINVCKITIRLSYNFLKYDYDKDKHYKTCIIPLIKLQKATGESGAIQNTCGI